MRDYGFLHHNARKTLQLIQLILQVMLNFCAILCSHSSATNAALIGRDLRD